MDIIHQIDTNQYKLSICSEQFSNMKLQGMDELPACGHGVYFFSFSPKVDFLGSVVTGTGSYVLHILIAQLWADV